MLPHGATFAAHSHTHGYLVRRRANESEERWQERVTNDILHCQRRLKDELGTESKLFAYPFGEYDTALKNIVDGLDLIGFGQHSGAVWSGSDFGALPRFPMAAKYADMGQFAQKVQSLPLPVVAAEPGDPLLPDSISVPLLRVRLAPGDYVLERLTCFVSGQGEVPVRWIDSEAGVFEVAARAPLPKGRSRYNCTAPHRNGGRYYWYSHLWIRN
jgi:hypothetical protein